MKNYKMFEKLYSGFGSFWGSSPNKIIPRLLRYIKHGSVLDLGMGEGRDAIFLASSGFSVEGVDISSSALKKTISIASEHGLKIKVSEGDARRFKFQHNYDAVICLGVLQLFSIEDIEKVIAAIKENVTSGGLVAISSFTVDNPLEKCPYPSPDGSYCEYYLFKKGEMRNFFSDWKILEYSEYMSKIHKHGDEKLHKHGMVSMIAKKPL
ncbi:MAG: methyltransferase domain-containing protein [Patescibacteria group bacterium]|nr:methyltransferase domain-containing protein [Patescibacteria group bacterium]